MRGNLFTLCVALMLSACSNNTDSQSSNKAFEDIHKCDEFAGHPDDPGKWAAGVTEDELIPGPAVKFCTEATKQYPDTPRFQFQLGRALLKANQYGQAVEALAEAAEREYGPAYAYLAEVYRYGLLGESDEKTAGDYYDLAIASGFAPAEEAKQSMLEEESAADDATPELTQGEQQEAYYEQPQKPLARATSFNPNGFALGGVLQALHDGDFQSLERLNKFDVNIYLSHLNNYFSQEYNMIDESCSAYGDPRLSRSILQNTSKDMGLNYGGNKATMSADGWKMMARGFKDLAETGGQGLINRAMDIEVVKKSATKDGVRLASQYGCTSPVFQQLYDNIASFVQGQSPKHVSGLAGLSVTCQSYATGKGSSPADAKKICSCFVSEFYKSNISDRDVKWLTKNYDQSTNFNKITKNYSGLNQKIAGCLL